MKEYKILFNYYKENLEAEMNLLAKGGWRLHTFNVVLGSEPRDTPLKWAVMERYVFEEGGQAS